MPVTAKLSRRFYEKLGDDVANELVEWFNRVDLTYRTELRDLNEVNFARFDAKLDQRVATLKAEIDQRITALEAKLDGLRTELIKWMFLFWVGSVGLALAISQLR